METAKDVSVQSDLPVFWSREATLALLSAYETQRERLGKDLRYKNYMWIEISHALQKEMGKIFTPAQCENRWRVLLRSYRRVVDNNLKSGRRKRDFAYHDEMQRIVKEEYIKPVSQLSETGVCVSGEKPTVQIGDISSEPEPVPSSSKELLINSGQPSVNSGLICSEPGPAPSFNNQLFIIRGTSNVNSDKVVSETGPAPNSNKQLFIIRGPPKVNSGKISTELEPASSSSKQLLIISGKPTVSVDKISGESQPAPSSSKKLFIINGTPKVKSDKIRSEHVPTPSNNESEPAAGNSNQLFNSSSKSSVIPPEKKRKLKQSFLAQIRADRKLYYEKKLEVDKERVEGLERKNDELLQLKKMRLQQTEKLLACEEEKLKCEKEKLSISREKLKMCVRLVQLQEENNEILRSINDQLDFLL